MAPQRGLRLAAVHRPVTRYLCLHLAEMRSRTVLEQAEFLMGLGMPRREQQCSRVDG